LRLAGHDQARRILRHGLEHLAGKEHQRQFDDREQNGEEDRRNQRKLDGGRALRLRRNRRRMLVLGAVEGGIEETSEREEDLPRKPIRN
jgi:hypothetical protein